MSEKRGFIRFLVNVFAPILLVVLGGGLAALGLQVDVIFLFWAGLIIAGVGLLWGVLLLVVHGPLDW